MPYSPGCGHQGTGQSAHLLREASLQAEVALRQGVEDLVDGRVRGQRAVEDAELPLQALGDVVAAAAWVDHGRYQLHVHHGGKFARTLKAVEAALLHQLPHNLISDLEWRKHRRKLNMGLILQNSTSDLKNYIKKKISLMQIQMGLRIVCACIQ